MDTTAALYPRVREYLKAQPGEIVEAWAVAANLGVTTSAVVAEFGALHDDGLVQRYGPGLARWDVGVPIGVPDDDAPDLKAVLDADYFAADRAEYGRFYAANPGELGEHNPTLGTRERVR